MFERGMGFSPYPLCAASAAGGALGLPEEGKAQGDQTGAQENHDDRIRRHDVPDVLDQIGQRRGVAENGRNSSGGSILNKTLLS